MTKQERFFYDNAAYGYDPRTETMKQGRERGAAALAKAEIHALQEGWTCEWNADRDGEPGEEYCILFDGYTVLASLHGIDGATDAYRRVVQAELALEAMGRMEVK